MSLRSEVATLCRLHYRRLSMNEIHRALRDAAEEIDSDPSDTEPDNIECREVIETAISGIK